MKRRHLGDRVRAITGALFSLLFLAAEAVGLVVVTKLLVQQRGAELAGVVTLQLYVVALVNIFFTSLGVLTIRAVASLPSPSSLGVGWTSQALQDLTGLQIKVFSGVTLLLTLLTLIGLAGVGTVSGNLSTSALLLSLGVLLRGVGLTVASHRVGQGAVGADKKFQLLFSVLFYGLSVALIHGGKVYVNGIALVFLAVSVVMAAWQLGGRRSLQAPGTVRAALQGVRWQMSSLDRQYAKFLLLSVGGFLVMNGDVFIVSAVMGPGVASGYSIAARIGVGIFSVAVAYSAMRLQPIASAVASRNGGLARRLWIECLVVAVAVAIAFSGFFLGVYPYLTQWIFQADSPVSVGLFALICVNSLIASFTGANGWPIIASSGHDLLVPTWLNGLLLLILGATGGYAFGLTGLLLGVCISHGVSALLHFRIAVTIFGKHGLRD